MPSSRQLVRMARTPAPSPVPSPSPAPVMRGVVGTDITNQHLAADAVAATLAALDAGIAFKENHPPPAVQAARVAAGQAFHSSWIGPRFHQCELLWTALLLLLDIHFSSITTLNDISDSKWQQLAWLYSQATDQQTSAGAHRSLYRNMHAADVPRWRLDNNKRWRVLPLAQAYRALQLLHPMLLAGQEQCAGMQQQGTSQPPPAEATAPTSQPAPQLSPAGRRRPVPSPSPQRSRQQSPQYQHHHHPCRSQHTQLSPHHTITSSHGQQRHITSPSTARSPLAPHQQRAPPQCPAQHPAVPCPAASSQLPSWPDSITQQAILGVVQQLVDDSYLELSSLPESTQQLQHVHNLFLSGHLRSCGSEVSREAWAVGLKPGELTFFSTKEGEGSCQNLQAAQLRVRLTADLRVRVSLYNRAVAPDWLQLPRGPIGSADELAQVLLELQDARMCRCCPADHPAAALLQHPDAARCASKALQEARQCTYAGVSFWHHHQCCGLLDGSSSLFTYSPACGSWMRNLLQAFRRHHRCMQQRPHSNADAKQLQDLLARVAELEAQLQQQQQQYGELLHKYQQQLQQHEDMLQRSKSSMVLVDQDLHADLKLLLEQLAKPQLLERLEKHSGVLALVLDQLRYLNQKDKRGMRWRPEVIRLALDVYAKSSGLIDTINESGVLQLPSGRQLQRYRQFSSVSSGWEGASMRNMATQLRARGKQSPEQQTSDDSSMLMHGVLAFDEMKIKKGLLYDPATDLIVGWTDTDAATEAALLEALLAEEGLADSKVSSSLATHLLQVGGCMLHGSRHVQPCSCPIMRSPRHMGHIVMLPS
jgi:hypothetical protein